MTCLVGLAVKDHFSDRYFVQKNLDLVRLQCHPLERHRERGIPRVRRIRVGDIEGALHGIGPNRRVRRSYWPRH